MYYNEYDKRKLLSSRPVGEPSYVVERFTTKYTVTIRAM